MILRRYFSKEPFYSKSLQLLTNQQLTSNQNFEFSFGFDQSSPNILSSDLITATSMLVTNVGDINVGDMF